MRVIGGSAKGRTLKSVPGDSTRPILDRVKTPLFDILRPRISGISMLDLFGGSGSVGIEALSQGAKHCVFLDTNAKAIETIKDNLEATKLSDRAEVRNADAFGYLRRCSKQFDFIFIAPPQYKGMWIEALREIAERPSLLEPNNGFIVVQIDPKEYEKLEFSVLEETEQRKYGNSSIIWYQARKSE